eukprot:g5101.t1
MGNAQDAIYFGEDGTRGDQPPPVRDAGEEAVLAEQVKEGIPGAWARENAALVDAVALACLRFRRYDVASARERMVKYFEWRIETFGDLRDQDDSEGSTIREFLKLGVVRVMPELGSRGHALINFRFRLTRPQQFNADQVLAGIHYVMMKTLFRSPKTQIAGVILMSDMNDAALSNLDREVPRKVLSMVNKNIPLRMAGIFMFRPNFMLQIVIPIIKMFMSAKLQRRLNILGSVEEVEEFGVAKSLRPVELGGTLSELPHVQMLWEEDGWRKTWVDVEGNRPKVAEEEEEHEELTL